MNHFTYVSGSVALVGLCRGRASWWWSVGSLLTCFTTASFHTVEVLVPGTFARMRAKHRWPAWYFHGGNLLLHWVPTIVALRMPPVVQVHHLVCACWIFWGWALWTSRGTMCFDAQYVPLPPYAWHLGHMIGVHAMMVYAM
jgi:hypothetical protein